MNPLQEAHDMKPLSIYLREVRQYDLLSRKKEEELARRYREENDLSAARNLVQSNLRLVVKIARDFRNGKMINLADLIQEGNLGLVHAVRKFDPGKKAKFSYYASFWIKAYIFKFILNNWSYVKIGTTQAQRKLFFNLKKTKNALIKEGLQPTPARIAARVGVTEAEVIQMEQRMQGRDDSLNEPVRSRLNEEQIDVLSSDDTSIEDHVADKQMRELVKQKALQFKNRLNPREAEIFDKRIFASQPMTLQKLGERYGISRERVRQIEGNILKKLRDYFKGSIPDYELYLSN
ncbi:MAG TPA: RNA polymerase factor sigma-32 [Desulfobacterales bacterium]